MLELIGALTLRESLHVTAYHGIVCHTGLLGGVYGLKNFDPIKVIPSGIYLTGFYSNYPTQAAVTEMITLIERGNIRPIIATQFTLDRISDAHIMAEKRSQMGKIVVTV
ncbi:MAG: zinc-binding dehydrogenase [Muribaculaceae bacterium]|nr:zinc-binding dehydrogenase [Muribaculaceae bacterium]